ncbi:hypothetical protein HQ496_12535 [bacterium]|nr:hypothetical protein [bacterium]
MIMSIVAVVAGYITWTVVFLGGSAGVRAAMASTHDAAGYSTDVSTLLVYLVLSVIASAGAGFVTAKVSKVKVRRDTIFLAVALLATGIPVQLSSWDLLPVWYNVAFLLLLAPVTIWGSTFVASKS